MGGKTESSLIITSSFFYRHESGKCRTLLFYLSYFLSFHLSRFSFNINILPFSGEGGRKAHIEGIPQGAGEETYEVAGRASCTGRRGW